MFDFTRRDLLVALTAGLTQAEAQHIHNAVEQAKAATGAYKPRAFTAHEYRTLGKLCELTFPGATEGGAAEFIDLLCSNNLELRAIYTGGIAWLDHQMSSRHGAGFADAKAEQQTAMLDLIAYRRNETAELAPGIRFFEWSRKMTADAYYTSKKGIADLGFMGNKGMAKFEVPAAAVKQALEKSGL